MRPQVQGRDRIPIRVPMDLRVLEIQGAGRIQMGEG